MDDYPGSTQCRKGSALSPALFLLVMDPLLKQLQSIQLGLTVNKFCAGGGGGGGGSPCG